MAVTIFGSGQIVVQVVQTVKSTSFSTTSSSFVDITGITATITPRNSLNRIYVIIDMKCSSSDASANTLRLLRNGTEVGGSSGTNGGFASFGMGAYTRENMNQQMFSYLDSPSTTSAVTYKVQGLTSGTLVNNAMTSGSFLTGRLATSTITLIEVAYA